MVTLREGESAPNFVLEQVDGPPIEMRKVLEEGNHILLVFLRYLG
jgi:peroxiredoxin